MLSKDFHSQLTKQEADILTVANKQNSPLLRLSGEIRTLIYNFVLGGGTIFPCATDYKPGLHVVVRGGLFRPKKQDFANVVSLIWAYRQTYSEAKLLPFKLNTFLLGRLPSGLPCLSDAQRSAIETIRFTGLGSMIFIATVGVRFFKSGLDLGSLTGLEIVLGWGELLLRSETAWRNLQGYMRKQDVGMRFKRRMPDTA